MLFSVVLLLLVSVTQASHYYGTLMTYYPQETYANGSVSVILRYKFNYKTCLVGSVSCSGNCGVERWILPDTKCEELNGTWCQSERITSRLLPNNSMFQLEHAGNSWIDNLNGAVYWKAVTDVELRNRSDTNRPNSSPQTTMFPALRVPSNCQRNINLLAFDPDGDEVKCRYANMYLQECVSPCTPPPVLSLSSSCTLSFSANSNSIEGWYAVQMVMQDFPRKAITLTQTDRSKVGKTTSDAISKIPIQFAFQVDPAAPSCSEGVYLPRFLVPTPEHGAQFYTPVSVALKINITAAATQSEITGLLVSGPYNVVKSSSGSGSFSLTWKPSASEDGQSHPICFVVQSCLVATPKHNVMEEKKLLLWQTKLSQQEEPPPHF
ncbi:uncharacterized protein LOC124881061 [Girardinichthys multiradiatus]|uniref:uncharacterized protein LOC124881061 n=1 Tax=Girardinichthys multiradiatus TaxID=208333 RepID=UPI001FABBBA3|nr:uncharacterized protein LOC124881061 [Girardinichthys multiradiatus]